MRSPPCRCGYLAYPHRYSHWCYLWQSQQEDDALYEWDGRTDADDAMDDPRRESRLAMPTEADR